MIKIDKILKIGKSHKVCEDYIISGHDPYPYIILSDGCSSSEDTDVGARILCYLARQYLLNYEPAVDTEHMGDWIIYNAEVSARQLGLKKSCLDATLIVATVINNYLDVYFYGDGFAVFVDKAGRAIIHETEYTKNAPYYLSYKIDPQRDDKYHDLGIELIETISFSETDEKGMINKYAYDTRYGIAENLGGYKTILICSDGLKSFYDMNRNELIDPMKLIQEFTSFKTTKGEFLKRRLLSKKGAISKFESFKIFHHDDLSIGAFHLED